VYPTSTHFYHFKEAIRNHISDISKSRIYLEKSENNLYKENPSVNQIAQNLTKCRIRLLVAARM
jgi:hypothetical protein